MGISDLRFGDAFGTWAIGAAMGAVAIFALMQVKSVEIKNPAAANRAYRRANPSYFWDLRDPGASQASWGGKQYNYNGIPVDGMLNGVDFDATQPRFSAFDGYTAPKNL